MSEAIAIARKWGNSIGITIPFDVVEGEKIKPNDKIVVSVKKVPEIKELFGTLKTKKSTDQIMKEIRTGWD